MGKRALFSASPLLALALASACGGDDVSVTAPPAADAASDAPPMPSGPFQGGPPTSLTVPITGLTGPVDVLRDAHGMVHIYATNVADAMRVEGYQVARDRTAQVELSRRNAEGRVAELLGDADPALIDEDIATRTLTPLAVAQAEYDALPTGSDAKVWLDAFADGISQFNARVRSGDEALPRGMIGIPQSAYEPFTGADVLAIGQFEVNFLSYTGEEDILDQAFADAARATFFAGAADLEAKKRAGFLVDVDRFAPLDPTTVMNGFPNDLAHNGAPVRHAKGGGPAPKGVTLPPGLLAAEAPYLEARARLRERFGKRGATGSNNWALAPSRAANGHAMIASDPHLPLSAAAVWWLVHVNVTVPPGGDASQNLDFAGVSFAGLPGIQIGFNGSVAWGATVAFHDVTDVYKETLTADGSAVVFNGQNVPLQKKHETIKVAGGGTVEYDVLEVPHHGPLLPIIQNHAVVPPDPKNGALSVKWTGLQPTHELDAVIGFIRAKNVEDARAAARAWQVGAQNWVFGDTSGNIFHTSQALVPKRDKRAFTWDPKTFTGQLPCFVLPGDGTAEWTGFLDEAYVPHVKNPAAGYIGTANADLVGTTVDNDPSNDVLPNGDPAFLTCHYVNGLRVGRIHARIEAMTQKWTLDDMAGLQGDARSPLGARLAPKLVQAIADAEAERTTPGTHPDLAAVVAKPEYAAARVAELSAALAKWGTDGDYDSASGVNPDDGSPVADAKEANAALATLVFDTWLARMPYLVFGDEIAKLGGALPPTEDLRDALDYVYEADKTKLATYDAVAGDSALFDDMTTPAVIETRDERAITALLDAVAFLNAKVGADRAKWRWGTLHTVHFDSLVPLWKALSIPPGGDATFPTGFPRHGDYETVDVASWFPPGGATLDPLDLSYHYGPSQRLVVELDPAGPIARDVLPGGEIWDNASPHFRDEAELWRRNQNHAVPFAHDDVAKAAESKTTYVASP